MTGLDDIATIQLYNSVLFYLRQEKCDDSTHEAEEMEEGDRPVTAGSAPEPVGYAALAAGGNHNNNSPPARRCSPSAAPAWRRCCALHLRLPAQQQAANTVRAESRADAAARPVGARAGVERRPEPAAGAVAGRTSERLTSAAACARRERRSGGRLQLGCRCPCAGHCARQVLT